MSISRRLFQVIIQLILPKVQPKQKVELDLKIDDNGDKDVLKENIALEKVNSVSKFMNYLKNLF